MNTKTTCSPHKHTFRLPHRPKIESYFPKNTSQTQFASDSAAKPRLLTQIDDEIPEIPEIIPEIIIVPLETPVSTSPSATFSSNLT